jgi:hypothetical protein
MSDYEDHFIANARLIILRFLAEDTANTSNDVLIQRQLEVYGVNRSRDFTRTQILALKDLGGVTVRNAGSAMIATLTPLGLDHVERRAVIAGVHRPSPPGG